MNGWIRNRQCIFAAASRIFFGHAVTITLFGLALSSAPLSAQEAEWIWSPDHEKEDVPAGAACHFRKTVTLRAPEAGQIAVAADDVYELFINGRKIGGGESTKKLDEYDLSSYLSRGVNVISIKATNRSGKTAAVAARLTLKEKNGNWRSYSTNNTWKTSLGPLPLWNTAIYNDRGWSNAQSFGQLTATVPWDRREDVPAAELSRSERFTIDPQFEVQQVLSGDATGSLIAMAFNEFGHILASKEGSGLLLIYDGNADKIPEKVRTYCDKVQNIQGILALNGDVFVTGEGPDGIGLYRLADKDRDGVLEDVRTLVRFKCSVAEHGPHGLVLGPDGLIYIVLGNHTQLDGQYEAGSPHRDYYEGDLLTPRYEDPGGHAVGIKAPGGAVIRTDTEGSGVQLVAGGLRNAYDLTFNREGDLFLHDADMESDEGMSWYRQTRICQIIPGGEYGWRSGWAKWPDYYPDSLPPVLETGHGSPAGIVAYNHFAFPARYHGMLFTADWSLGRILAVRLKKNGAGYTASSEVFLEGNPLNVTDLDVGPDGWLYFITGGRGTSGGVYRVTWKGQIPKEVSDIGTGLTAVIRQPQPGSSWARQNIAAIKRQLGTNWDSSLLGVARTAANPAAYRLQALDLMQLYGPAPTESLLTELSREPNELVRARAVELMGLHPTPGTQQRLVELLEDSDRTVRRKACEALARADQGAPVETVLKLLASDDRYEAWAARRILERMDVAAWREQVLAATTPRLLVQGGLALLIAKPSKENALAVLEQVHKAMGGFVSDRDFVDLLRLVQVAVQRGPILPEDVPGLKRQLAEEFPAGDPLMNRELVRLLMYFQESSIIDRYLAYLKSDAPDIEKLHLAMHLRFLESGWTADQRLQLLSYYEEANQRKGGGSYARYVINATRDFCQGLNEEESRLVLAQGHRWPNAALGALYKMPPQLDAETFQTLTALDAKLATVKGDSTQRLQVGIVAVLARSGDQQSIAYLRKLWDESPERRPSVAVGLAQHPAGENWTYVLRSLPLLEPAAATGVCRKLTEVENAPEEAEPYRQVILLGLKMRQKEPEKADAAAPALNLLYFWTGEEIAAGQTEDKQLAAWQKWFSDKYPSEPEARLPVAAATAKYSYEDLLEHLASDQAHGDAARGEALFVRAQCAKCHRFGGQGESFGPDLTTIGNRFTRKELLESIVYPSQTISSQYASKTIRTTDGRTITGLVLPGGLGETIVVQQNGERVTLAAGEIEETKPSKVSSMPAGLLEPLTLEEIADLFAFLQGTKAAALTRLPGESGTK
jgi:putative heme-binding domain-containing protein